MDSNDNEYEYKWVLKDGRTITEFSDFKVAKNTFKRSIIKAISEEYSELFDGEPFALVYYFQKKYDNRAITDEEIVIEKRTEMLLQYLLYSMESEELKAEILRTISKDYSYHGVYESDDETIETNISIVRNPHEIIIRLHVDYDGVVKRLETNAFAIEDDGKEYFYIIADMINQDDGSVTIDELQSKNITLRKVRLEKMGF